MADLSKLTNRGDTIHEQLYDEAAFYPDLKGLLDTYQAALIKGRRRRRVIKEGEIPMMASLAQLKELRNILVTIEEESDEDRLERLRDYRETWRRRLDNVNREIVLVKKRIDMRKRRSKNT